MALNPFKEMCKLYSPETVLKYRGISMDKMEPHVFAVGKQINRNKLNNDFVSMTVFLYTANNVMRSLRDFKKSQSIVISGETSAGKTETSKHLLNFIGESVSTQLAEHMLNANILLEAFGNSCTAENSNSSRFIKLIQVQHEASIKITGTKIHAYLLETNRVCAGSHGTFHVFQYLLEGSPKDLRDKLDLNSNFVSHNYQKSSKNYITHKFVYFILFVFSPFCQYLFEQKKHSATYTNFQAFGEVDRIFDYMAVGENEKNIIYEFLAAILHLGNIQFRSVESQAQILDSSRKHIYSAANLLKVNAEDLEKSLLAHSIDVLGITIT